MYLSDEQRSKTRCSANRLQSSLRGTAHYSRTRISSVKKLLIAVSARQAMPEVGFLLGQPILPLAFAAGATA